MDTFERIRRPQYLLNLPFIIGLVLLIINDHYLKDLYGNWLTGKLSDFAGILILPLFLKYLFKTTDKWSVFFTAIVFTFWKSTYADPAIEWYNFISPIPLTRVVDYTDLLAFIMLPLSYHILKNIDDYSINLRYIGSWPATLVFAITVLSFASTSREDDFGLFIDSTITSCCDQAPTVAAVGSGTIFIPNIFTPDNNGINDVFQIIADTGIIRIDTLEIKHIEKDSVIFSRENITIIDPSTGWDGRFNNTIVPAQFFYRISVSSIDGTNSQFLGYVCCIPCARPTGLERPLALENCGFSTQYNPDTKLFDPNTPSLEQLDCFE